MTSNGDVSRPRCAERRRSARAALPALRAGRHRRSAPGRRASSSAPGAATTPGCSPRTSRTRCSSPRASRSCRTRRGDAPRRAKMVAEKRLPRGTTDIQGLSAANMFEMNEAGVSSSSTTRRSPNAKNLLPTMKYPYGDRAHLFGQGRRLQPEADHGRAEELQGCARSQARQQARHHRHPVPVRDGGRRAGRTAAR